MKNKISKGDRRGGRLKGFAFYSVLLILGFLTSCGSSGDLRNANVNSYNDLQNLVVVQKEFAIENQWANPMGGNRVDLIGNTNYIRINGDRVELFLPYFGVRHSGGAYNSEGGIKYEGPIENLQIEERDGKSINVTFKGRQGSEDLDFLITLFPGGSAITNVNSSERQSISYQGRLKVLPEQSL